MTEVASFAFPEPRDDDDDDVAWVLQAGAAEWHRGAYGDAVVWLRRGVDAANAAGNAFRAAELNALADELSEQMGLTDTAALHASGELRATTDLDELITEVDESDFLDGELIAAEEAWQGTDGERAALDLDGASDAPTLRPERARMNDGAELGDALDAPTLPPARNPPTPDDGTELGDALDAPTLPPARRPTISHETLDLADPLDAPTLPPEREHTVANSPKDSDERESEHEPAKPEAPAEPPGTIDGVPLEECAGFEDLSEEAQAALARTVRILELQVDEEINGFGAALVTRGAVAITPEIGDELGAMATKGDAVFAQGTLVEGTKLRVVATTERTRVGVWSAADLHGALLDCPWVDDELKRLADRFQALAGATLGMLGERLDLSLRRAVTDRMEVKAYGPGESIVIAGVAVPGLYVVGAGRVELVAASDPNQVVGEHHPGDFLFAESVIGASPAPLSARAASGGALVLFTSRRVAQELMTSVPLFLEALAS